MLKDNIFKIIAVASLTMIQFYCFSTFHSFNGLIFTSAILFFIPFSLLSINSAIPVMAWLRTSNYSANMFIRLGFGVMMITLISAVVLFVGVLMWHYIIFQAFEFQHLFQYIITSIAFIIFCTLVYEILFLTKERELDSKVIKHLEDELENAEINILKNELDPHFVYNSLMPLYYLIKNDVPKAEAFTYKLMQVYQHFLENRKKDIIPFDEELKFIHNYFFLLQIRYKDCLFLKTVLPDVTSNYSIIPFTLQLLIENAVKHNDLSTDNPLEITISFNDPYLIVSNKLTGSAELKNSSKIGLKNLRTRYRIIHKLSIDVFRSKEMFIVKVPLLKSRQKNVINSYNRG